ncbi:MULTISPECIES: response regulator [unclassified Roseofilum]|uniref:hybrid sensor histidine kinase/response regulator n=1 Tax=unclassified Roseofilum TaxID=2620099 RepID=UPI001B034695|nr:MULTISPECIES: response regulator [unclassified Roseofilum]MBP0008815.1 response regulator [Roseofilum sp. Belize Diploria]MBP0033507.1 response regulator [Roseofilum sp. Belize BBD 4]
MNTSSSDQKTLLVVDDNPTNIKVLFNFLKEEGFKVLVAKDGLNALEKLASIQPDLILLDIMMPGIDGFETCHRIKKDPNINTIPIIFMTALADANNKVKGLSSGAVDYITKPFQQEEVLARINLHLQLQSLTQELASVNASLEQKVEERTAELKTAQSQLVLTEKMSSLGQLVAGIVHEINNPVGFIAGNIAEAKSYAQDLIQIIQLYQEKYPEPGDEILDELDAIEFDYLQEDFPKLLKSMEEGTNRITSISQSMRTFSRADSDRKVSFNCHDGIDSTLMILRHRLKAKDYRPEIKITKNYGELPPIACYPGQLNQVFMNLLANAIDALEDSNQGKTYEEIQNQPNEILITTSCDTNNHQVKIDIQDNGAGMKPEIQQKVFDYLFTTKGINKGTGLGLAISRQIIEDKHQGTLNFTSQLGEGTTFTLALPVKN